VGAEGVAVEKPANISVLIPVKNEERNLPDCLASVAWSDDILVVDSQSTDRTGEIARQAGAQVVQFHYDGGPRKKKNWALDTLSFQHEWVLIVDADERVPPALKDEMFAAIQAGEADGFYLNRRFYFMGRWIKHGGWYPSWNLRLFKHRLGRYEKLGAEAGRQSGDVETHEHVVLDGRVAYLRHDLIHEDYRDLFDFIERHNRYSSWDARVYRELVRGGGELNASLTAGPVERKRRLKKIWVRLPFRPLLRFFLMYVLRGGFLDGRAGFHFCLLQSINEYHIGLKIRELRQHERGRIGLARG
jgi:glycosyltransferase involved in cell wall biosynthesis